jgi:hypothetical protein
MVFCANSVQQHPTHPAAACFLRTSVNQAKKTGFVQFRSRDDERTTTKKYEAASETQEPT